MSTTQSTSETSLIDARPIETKVINVCITKRNEMMDKLQREGWNYVKTEKDEIESTRVVMTFVRPLYNEEKRCVIM